MLSELRASKITSQHSTAQHIAAQQNKTHDNTAQHIIYNTQRHIMNIKYEKPDHTQIKERGRGGKMLSVSGSEERTKRLLFHTGAEECKPFRAAQLQIPVYL